MGESNGGAAESVTGSLSIDSKGVISANISLGGDPLELDGFQMNNQKDFIAGVDGESEYSIGGFAKFDTGYTTADLQGNWALLGFYESATSEDAGWIRGLLEIAGTNGVVTSGSIRNSDDGPPENLTGLPLSISATGRISSPGLPFTQFQLAEQRSLAVGFGLVDSESELEPKILFLVKQPSGVQVADVAGDWKIISFYDLSSENDPGYTRGKVQVTDTGTISGGGIDDSSGPHQSIIGRDAAVASDGAIEATIVYLSAPLSARTLELQLSTDLQVLIGTATDPGGDPYRNLQIAFVPEPSLARGALFATIALAVLRRRSS